MYGPLHDLDEVSQVTGWSKTTVRRRIREGDLLAVKMGSYRNSQVRVPQSAIDEFLAKHVVQPSSHGGA